MHIVLKIRAIALSTILLSLLTPLVPETAIEGFGGKRALGFLLKIELCRKRSKFRMQFCLGALNNVLYVFLLKFSLFTRYYICKKACICDLISM